MIDKHPGDVLLAGAKIVHHHVCAFFHSQREEYGVLLPFIKEGLESGEKAFHIVDPTLQQEHRQYLETVGLDTEELERRKQLEIRVWEQAYLRSNGGFELGDMLSLIQEVLRDGQTDGFPRTRLVAHMEWSTEDRPGVKDLIEYEARLNYVLPQYKDPVICVYDLAKFSAGIVIDILRTHPMVIIGGTLQINPFYVEPDEFLKELESRQV
jgi:hypothetical protein